MIDVLDSTIHFPFSIPSGTSMPSLPLALLRSMVHHGQAFVDPSSITIMIHTILCVFNTHTLIVEGPDKATRGGGGE
jgi:hypothetical protein